MKENPIITIDGPAGAGKSTISKLIANKLSFIYLDTGALYRALAYGIMKKSFSGTMEDAIDLCRNTIVTLEKSKDSLRVYVDGADVTEKIRTEEIGLVASTISSLAVVRDTLLSAQRQIGASGKVVAEGRDTGTVIFPNADLKFFLDASVKERATRRYLELIAKGERPSLANVENDLLLRDRQDRERSIAPLQVPRDAIVIDSSGKNISEVVDTMMSIIEMM